MAFDWLAAIISANQKAALKTLINWHRFEYGNILVIQTHCVSFINSVQDIQRQQDCTLFPPNINWR